MFIPDMQTMHSVAGRIEAVADWIVANKDTYKIAVVLDAGDATNTNEVAEWATLDTAYAKFDAINLPYLVTPGNHDGDIDVGAPVRGAMVEWNATFPTTRYTTKSWWNGGFFEAGQSQNAYLIIGNYLYMSLEHVPRQIVIDWANTIAAANPTKKVVMITHAMEASTDGRFSTFGDDFDADNYYAADNAYDGDQIWAALCKLYANFHVLLSGHFVAANVSRHLDTGDLGNKVESEFVNYQNNADGVIRLISFYSNGMTLRAQTYKIGTGWLAGATVDFTVDLS